MKNINVIATILVGIFLLSGCDNEPVEAVDEDKVLARINGQPITEYDLGYWLRGAHGQDITPGMKEATLERLVDNELIYQKGRELGLHKNELYRKEVRNLELQLRATQRSEMMRRVYNQEIAADIEVSPEEVRKYFDNNKDRFARTLHLGTLEFDTVAEAKAVRESITKGEAFEDVAATSEDGWDIGPLSWSKIPLEWHDVVYELEPGEVSAVFQGERTGIRLFKLLGTEKAESVEFKSVRNSIMNRLRNARTRDVFKSYIAGLRKDANIERYDR